MAYQAGLPDGLFSNQEFQFGLILESLAMENLGTFYDHLVYFTAVGNILWPFGVFCGHLVCFPRSGILYQEKSGNPATKMRMEPGLREPVLAIVGKFFFILLSSKNCSFDSQVSISLSAVSIMLP
jgi:hypothetical protein